MPAPNFRISRRAVIWTVSVALLYLLVGFLLLPMLARPMLADALHDKLQRPVTIGALKFNPLTLAATVQQLSIGEKDPAQPPLLQVGTAHLNLQAWSIWERAPVIKEARLEEPKLNLVRNADSSYNFDDLIAIFSAPSDGPPAKFAINNIRLAGGNIQFDDQTAGARHTVSDIQLAIPFLSNLPYATDSTVTPELAATINGAPFKLTGQSRPFSPRHDTAVQISLQQVDLPPYLKYVPVPLGFTLASGKLHANLTVAFHQPEQGGPQVTLSGTGELHDIAAQDKEGKPLLAFTRLAADLAGADLVTRRVQLKSVTLEKPLINLLRDRRGEFNLARLVPPAPAKPAVKSTTPGTTPASPANTASSKEAPNWQVLADAISVTGGLLIFKDMSLGQPFETRLSDIGLTVKEFDSAPNQTFSLDASLQSDAGEKFQHAGRITLAPFKAQGEASLAQLNLKRYAPYYASAAGMLAQQGMLDVSSRYQFEGGSKSELLLQGLTARLDKLALRKQGGTADFLRIAGLQIKGGELDLAKRSLRVGSLQSSDGKVALLMDADGQLKPLENEAVPRTKKTRTTPVASAVKQVEPATPAKTEKTEKTTEQPWRFELASLALDGYGVRLQSMSRRQTSVLSADALRLRATGLSNARGSTGTLALQGRLGNKGSLRVDGKVGIAPLDLDLRLDVRALELVPLQPLFSKKLNLTLTDGMVSTRGRLRLATRPNDTLRYAFNGDASVNRLSTIDKQSGEDFLRWRSLRVRQIDAASEPALKLAIGEVTLADFFTRLVINADGSFNYQDLLKKDGEQPDVASRAATNPAAQQGKPAKPEQPVSAQPVAAAPMQVSVGKVVLQGGHVDFKDNFIKPNYSADLTQLNGSVSGLSSDPGMLAEVDVKGRVENQGQLDITGKVNPLSGNLFLDLLASLKDFELSPLTPYAAKYAGYGIERGKLSFDVRYRVEDKKLTAENRLVLNRLTFGEPVESPDAVKLPVRLAVALLQDRNGNIDLDLPISGSLDDPQFSIGGVIVKAIFNLIGRAVTAPFSLIAGMFAQDDQGSHIGFASGRSDLQPRMQQKLDSLAKALQDRPGLKLDISGRADADFDSAGLRQVALDRKLKLLKSKQLVREGESVPSIDEVEITAAEYPKYLARAYAQENISDKPRNVIGMAKSIPPEQMKAMLLQHVQVSQDDIRLLANQRAQDVKDYLVQQAKVPSERLFIVGAKPPAAGESLPPARVDFVLGVR